MALWGSEASTGMEQQQQQSSRQRRGAGARRPAGGSSGGSLLAWGTTAAVCLVAVAQGFVLPGAARWRAGAGARASLIPRRAGVLSQLDFKPAVDVYAKFPEQHAQPKAEHGHEELTLLDPAGVKLSVTGAAPNGAWFGWGVGWWKGGEGGVKS